MHFFLKKILTVFVTQHRAAGIVNISMFFFIAKSLDIFVCTQEILEKSEFSPNLKMLSFFCFSKLGAPLFRFFLSHPETSISGENPCFSISGGYVHPSLKHQFSPKSYFFIFKNMILVKIDVLVVGVHDLPR